MPTPNGCPDPGGPPTMSTFTNCGQGGANDLCNHKLSYANGKLSLEIGGCTDSIELAIAGLSPAELATALTNLLASGDPAVQTALTQMIKNVVNSMLTPTSQQLIDAINGAIASGAIVLPKPSCADIQAIFTSGVDPTGKFLLGADCKKYSVESIAALAALDPAKLVDVITNNTLVKNAINATVNQGIANGGITIPPAGTPLDCGSLSALFSPGAAPTATTKLFGEGCKTFTVSQLATAVAAAGADAQTLSIVGPKLLISNGNDVALADILIGALSQSPMPAALVSSLSSAIGNVLSNPASTAAINGVKQIITDTVTCAFVGNLFPLGTDALAGTERFMTTGCHSHTLASMASYIAANTAIAPANIAPGNLPTSVKVSCASLTATSGVPAALDELLTIGCKTLKIKQVVSSMGTLLPRWDIVAA
jgi:hypothetical protein